MSVLHKNFAEEEARPKQATVTEDSEVRLSEHVSGGASGAAKP